MHINIVPTPLEKMNILSKKLGINLYVKRDDLFFLSGGGTKARKLQYIIHNAKKNNYDSIVSAGSCQSNHLRATAIICAKLGWKFTAVVHEPIPKDVAGNYYILKMSGAKIKHIDKKNVSKTMNCEIEDFRKMGHNPLYIWGGGHSIEGSYALYKAVEEVKFQSDGKLFDFIFHASGTGTTQAGLHLGCEHFLPSCQVIGISIARKKNRGLDIIKESILELSSTRNLNYSSNKNIVFDDNFVGGGYGYLYPELIDVIKQSAQDGLILDPTYTGKAFLGLKKYIENGYIKSNSNVIFWHTGGFLNLLASNKEIII